MPGNTILRYGAVAQLLHWLVVALIITQFLLAFIFEDMPLGLEKIAMIARHKAVGMTILGLAVLRLVWRLVTPPPPLPDTLKNYEQRLAKVAHWGLYGLILALPLSGWLMSSVANIPVSYFGWFEFPSLWQADKSLISVFKTIHEVLVWLLVVLLALHVGAALRHHFWLKDGVLLRMLPAFIARKSQ